VERPQKLIDQIYAAALDATVWPLVLETLEQMFGCIASGIYTTHLQRNRVSPVNLRGIDAALLDCYIGRFLCSNPWREVPALQRQGYVRTDNSLDRYYRKQGFYHKTELYNEWMKPQDFIHTLGINLYVDGYAQTKCFLYRPRQMRPFTTHDIDRFRWVSGHLANAVRVARRLAVEESSRKDLLAIIDRMTCGVLLLDTDRHIIQANPFAEALLRRHDGLVVRHSRLVTSHRGDERKLAGVIRCALAAHLGSDSGAAHLASLRRPEGRSPLCAVAIPLPRQTPGPFQAEKAAVALILNDPEQESVVSVDWLQQRYQLTKTEARLTRNLSQGSTLRQAATAAELSYETARWYLKSIFQKTGTSRQTELIRALLSEQIVIRNNLLH